MQHCSKKNTENKLINNLKLSVFCGIKGFFTFNLACFSYLESLAYRRNTNEPAFAMRRNVIPFFEMITIIPTVCFFLMSSMAESMVICAILMISACFMIRTFNLCEKMLEKTTCFSIQEIKEELYNDTIIYPIFSKNSKYIKYSTPDREQIASHSLIKERESSFFVNFLLPIFLLPIKVLQSCMLLSLSIIELLESLPSLIVDLSHDRKFQSTQSNLQKCCHLLHASVRNITPISRFDEPIAELIGAPNKIFSCCQ